MHAVGLFGNTGLMAFLGASTILDSITQELHVIRCQAGQLVSLAAPADY
jgi:hypothetical protein